MEVYLIDTESKESLPARIEKATGKDLPLKKDGWSFNWKTLYHTEGAEVYKIVLTASPFTPEGMLMLTLMNGEMLYMNNIEIAPHNLGQEGKYGHVAGCLIAFGCKLSFEKGKEAYKGYLTFESKSVLVDLYRDRYGASRAMGNRMFIEPKQGLELIKKYLE